MDHGIPEGREPLTLLPQFLPIGLTEALIQPLDKKTKKKGKLSAMIYDIYKPTHRISTWVNPKKLLSVTNAPCISHEALPRDRLVSLDAYSQLPFVLETLFCGLFSLAHLGGRLKRFH